MEYKYDHFGVPTKTKREGMVHFPEYGVWCSDFEKDPYRIEWIFFEKGSPMHPLIQSVPHVCFLVKDIERAVRGKKLLMAPVAIEGHMMAFIEEDGVPIEFLQQTGK